MNEQRQTIPARVIARVLFFVIVIPLLPLLISRQWDWWEAWVYAFIYIFGFAASRALAARRHPDLLAERARLMQHEDIEPWDRWLAPLVGLGGGLIPLVAGLDALLGWPPDFSLRWELVALAFSLAAKVLVAAQKEPDAIVAWLDLSRTCDPDYLHRCGLDLDRLLFGSCTSLWVAVFHFSRRSAAVVC